MRKPFYLSFVFVIILACSHSSLCFGYTLRTNKDGKVLIWNKKNAAIIINTSLVADVGGAADAIQAAFATWTTAGIPMKINFKESSQVIIKQSDGQNVVSWQTSDWKYGKEVVAMTIAMYSASTGIVSETDIVLNARDHRWTTSPSKSCDKYDIQNVMAHEVGHFFGLGHEPSRQDATMFPTTPPGETSKRNLTTDDRAGIVAMIQEYEQRQNKEVSPVKEEASTPEAKNISSPEIAETGCSIGGTNKANMGFLWFPIMGLLGLLSRFLKNKSRTMSLLPLTLAGMLLSLPSAHGSMIHKMSLEDLIMDAELVVHGEVLAYVSYSQDGLIYTDYKIRVKQCLKQTCQSIVTMQTLGGEINGIGMIVEGIQQLKKGEEILVFCRKNGSKLISLGLSLGMFRIINQKAFRDLTGMTLWNKGKIAQGKIEELPLKQLQDIIKRTLKNH